GEGSGNMGLDGMLTDTWALVNTPPGTLEGVGVVQLIIEADFDAATERIFFDDISFSGGSILCNDQAPPALTCPDDISLSLSDNCEGVVDFTPTATDDCTEEVSIISTPASGSIFTVGVTDVSVTATDAAGNMSSCSFNVILTDAGAPTLSCPENIVASADTNCSAVLEFTPVVVDNCPGNLFVQSTPASGEAFPLGSTTVNVTATDAASNSANCSFTIEVVDDTPPTLTCPDTLIRDRNAGVCTYQVVGGEFDPGFADNCPSPDLSNDFNADSSLGGEVFSVGDTMVTWTVTDGADATVNCMVTILINDPDGQCTVGVQDNILAIRDLKIFPNPFKGQVAISFTLPGHSGEVNAEIFNLYGQQLHHQRQTRNNEGSFQFFWEGNDYPAGVYLLRLQANGKLFAVRLLKQ
ncbi:MAG: HYR domain-containing protein, partial [Bacteroidota bacterium]